MNQKSNASQETEKIGKLMQRCPIPCIISLLVGALYNIVDQIFIANASYLGSYGNAANTVVFPLTVVALAIAVMIGDTSPVFKRKITISQRSLHTVFNLIRKPRFSIKCSKSGVH